jgi:PQQ-like domain
MTVPTTIRIRSRRPSTRASDRSGKARYHITSTIAPIVYNRVVRLMRRVRATTLAVSLTALCAGCSADPPPAGAVWSFRSDRPWLAGDSQVFAPAVDGRTIYFCGGYSYSDRSAIYALARADGAVRWSHRLARCEHEPFLLAGTLLVHAVERDGNRCVVNGFDPLTGAVKWRIDLDRPRHLCGAAAVAAGDAMLLVFADNGDDVRFMRVAAADGAIQRFTVPRPDQDRRIWLAAGGSDAWFGSGASVWRWRAGALQPDPSASLARSTRHGVATIGGSRLVIDEGEGHRLHAFDLGSGALLWERPAFSRSHGRTADADVLYVNVWRHGFDLVALDLRTGAQRWAIGQGGFNAPLVANGRLYADGWFSVFAADPATGRVLRTIASRREITTSPVVDGDLLLFGTITGALHALPLEVFRAAAGGQIRFGQPGRQRHGMVRSPMIE